jgi:DNA polymerase III gamma/tau subunit
MLLASYTLITITRYEGQGKKRRTAASVTTAVSVVPKSKKIKVLTHRPRYIEPGVVLELGEGASLTAEARQAAPIAQSFEEPTVVLKMPTVGLVEAKDDKAEEPKVEETMKMPEILSPPTEAKMPKMQKASAATPKRRRMASVLDAVLETTKALSPAPTKKIAEATKAQAETEVGQAEAEAGPSVPRETRVVTPEDEADQQTSDAVMAEGQDTAEKAKSPAPEVVVEDANYIYRHASGKKLSEEEVIEARHYARKLKYPKGALVFNGANDDDFLYCLPDNKEISVCREMAKSMGFPKLEEGLSVLSKDELADSLAYNSIKV